MKKVKTSKLMERAGNVAAVLFYMSLFYRTLKHFVLTGYSSGLLLLVFEGFIIFLFLIRNAPKNLSRSVYDWGLALAGTCLPMLFATDGTFDTAFLHLMQVVGMLVSFSGAASLNKSFGLVAANRGVKTTGVYRYVRHPIYAGYFISFFAFFLQNPSLYNAIILLLIYVTKVLRIFAEEEILVKDEKYERYMDRVRWRLCPFIF